MKFDPPLAVNVSFRQKLKLRDGVIEIQPQPLPVTLERRGRLLVASPARKVPPLRASTVERTRHDLRTGRGR